MQDDTLERRIDAVELQLASTREMAERIGKESRGINARLEILEKGCHQRSTELAVLKSDHLHSREVLLEIKELGKAHAEAISTIILHIDGLKNGWTRQMLGLLVTAATAVLGIIWVWATGK
jgi:hypothetical protein